MSKRETSGIASGTYHAPHSTLPIASVQGNVYLPQLPPMPPFLLRCRMFHATYAPMRDEN